MVNPVPGSTITARYRQPGSWAIGWHTGCDFAAPVGTRINTMTNGKVIAANAYDKAYGYKVIIEFESYEYWYCHMNAGAATVKVGQLVEAGQKIGSVGMSGNTTGPHCHVEKRIKGGKYAASTFRDPMPAVAWKPPAFCLQSWNLSWNNKIGAETQDDRRGKLLTDILRPNADVSLFQEMPMSQGAGWLKRNIHTRVRGREQGQRQIFGESGRYAWGGKHVRLIAKGDFTYSEKKVTWGLVRIDTYRKRLVVNVHGPYGISSARKLAYWKKVWATINTIRVRYKLEWWQVIVGGDTNGPKEFLTAAKKYGHKSALPKAHKKINGGYATTNGWKPKRRLGARIDVISVQKGVEVLEYRNVTSRANSKGKLAIADHQRQVLILR